MRVYPYHKQQGAALIVALLMLLILTIIGISGMNDSIFDLRMTGNIQSHYDSLQQSDSGISAAVSQINNFTSTDKADIFSTGGTNELKDYIDPTVNLKFLYQSDPFSRGKGTSSGTLLRNELYIVDSDHSDSGTGANTHIFQGVYREIQSQSNTW